MKMSFLAELVAKSKFKPYGSPLKLLLPQMKTSVATAEATARRILSICRPRANGTFRARVTHRPTDLHDMHGTQKQSSRMIANLLGNVPGAMVHGPDRPSEASAGKCLLMRHMRRTRQPRDRLRRTCKGARGACPVGTNHPRLPSPKSTIVRNDADRARSWYERARSAAGWGEAAHGARERGRCAQGMGSTRVARAQASTPVCGDHAGASACAGGAPGRFTDHRAQEGPRQLGLIPDRL
jgi:hypothetical protein